MSKRARLIIKDRVTLEDGAIVEVRLWEVSTSKDKPSGYKYSLAYIVKGERLVGYDNSEGKGDHRHYGSKEKPYHFRDIDTLIRDFLNDVQEIRGGKGNEGKED